MATPDMNNCSLPRISPGLAAATMAAAWLLASPAAAQAPPVTPADFLAAASGANAYEVMAARLALVESRNARVRAYAEDMIRDHTAANTALAQAAMRSGLKPPSTNVGGDQTMLLAALQGLRGPDFDRAYARQQLLAHRYALSAEGGYARDGGDSSLRGVAKADMMMINRHLQAATALQQATER